ncbi:zinc ribbon domain-containing protein [uncultured Alistipes sp.]|uniref:zinc ribbon domain-containing protein n=1 Tax=uncultured Alistipes sp. TaxID=538949 RepID=UPI0034537738
MYCSNCGKEIAENAIMCPACGAPAETANQYLGTSDKDWLTTLLLCFFLGGFGVHSFYTGKALHRCAPAHHAGRLRHLGIDRLHHDHRGQL